MIQKLIQITRQKKHDARKQEAINLLRERITSAGFWFVDIPRTGSTSLKTLLEEKFGADYGKSYSRETGIKKDKILMDHLPACEVKELIGNEAWSGLFTFSIVRNPWARAFSLFRYRVANEEIPENVNFTEYLRLIKRINTRHKATPYVYKGYFYPMSNYIYDHEGKIMVDYIGRYESLQKSFSYIINRIGLTDGPSKVFEKLGNSEDYRQTYTQEGIDIVSQCYADDIENFGYQF